MISNSSDARWIRIIGAIIVAVVAIVVVANTAVQAIVTHSVGSALSTTC